MSHLHFPPREGFKPAHILAEMSSSWHEEPWCNFHYIYDSIAGKVHFQH